MKLKISHRFPRKDIACGFRKILRKAFKGF
jgi:hypothetical protein